MNGSAVRVAIGAFLLLSSVAGQRPARAVSVETFVLTIAGETDPGPGFSCTTGGPATPALSFFLGSSPNVPSEGLGPCGIGGAYRTTTIASDGPTSDTLSLSNGFGSSFNTFAGSSLALARSGSAIAKARATITGPLNSLIYEGASSYALFNETLTATSPSVPTNTPGTLRLTFSVAGSLSVTGPPPFTSTAGVDLNYSIAGGPSFTLMRAQASREDIVPFAISGTGAPLTGFTLAPGSFAGSGAVDSLELPFTWGQPFDLKFGLLASAIPGTGATADVDFSQAATLTGIRLYRNGQLINDFTIASASGTPYGAAGVPEPASAAMLASGVVAIAAATRGRKRRSSR